MSQTGFQKQVYVQELWIELIIQLGPLLRIILHIGSGKSLNKPPDT